MLTSQKIRFSLCYCVLLLQIWRIFWTTISLSIIIYLSCQTSIIKFLIYVNFFYWNTKENLLKQSNYLATKQWSKWGNDLLCQIFIKIKLIYSIDKIWQTSVKAENKFSIICISCTLSQWVFWLGAYTSCLLDPTTKSKNLHLIGK